jgi:hypothetical protein
LSFVLDRYRPSDAYSGSEFSNRFNDFRAERMAQHVPFPK